MARCPQNKGEILQDVHSRSNTPIFNFVLNYFSCKKNRVENLNKFKSDDGDCPTLVCTDLAARGLDLDVDHVIMFDFPKNSVSMISLVKLLKS